MRKSGSSQDQAWIKPGFTPLQSVIGMMECWGNEILSSEKRTNGLLAEFYNGEINGIF